MNDKERETLERKAWESIEGLHEHAKGFINPKDFMSFYYKYIEPLQQYIIYLEAGRDNDK